MPVLLDSARAPLLDELLADTDTQGLTWQISVPPSGTLPRIQGLGTLATSGPTEISFLSNPRYQGQLQSTGAGAVIVSPDVEQALAASTPAPGFVRVVASNPYLLYARIAQWFDRARRPSLPAGVHPTAVVADDAVLEPGVRVGPHCVVESGVRIGPNTVLGPGCIVGAGSSIGADGLLHARVTLYAGVTVGARVIIHSGAVLGADGFGFAPDPARGRGAWGKIPQFGGVSVGDDVEIGANTTIDRGALEDTQIGDGVKLDNQIMVAHNVRIGAHTAVAACVGIAGSTTIGQRCTIGGAAMLSGHLTLADDVHISGGTAITSNISKPGRYSGVYPYAEHGDWQRNAAVIQQLGQLRRRVRALEQG
ncbi:UDP-3-O-(3-hydroxymyristoyl)glucosamine N-acyltransferase [Bordetella genomosp. 9]|uniref:UDP-3-O-acylglucosamine N-acyltransferase n=1 Tax=Bordetella genomosp. 9 TaxID=1416803 RepID=A0A1W6Z1B4_9BORD|nr:UDP-3-O-(3-hydroxymyristoyl)glucosamine N-acyltransferase [Bordetella genomosp. 9]ARP86899.1 UDP-3-O-(3-hydroxymyristoyl)glucosamine N-acyltransferase [Bordetella genomosp. 9]ARP90885.1 UDP-3-O-(3-hydroxymyristoyl)glucosamine N-acyltransferase [Bordetella genomosp. 9]